MRRVAHISLHGDPLEPLGSIEAGGQNVYVKNVAVELAKQGVEVDCFTRLNDPRKRLIEAIAPGARSIRLNGGPAEFIRKERTLDYIPQLLEHFLSFSRTHGLKYDLIHTHYYLEGALGLEIARMTRLPQAHTFHSLGQIKLNYERLQGDPDVEAYAERLSIEQGLMGEADLLVATSPYEARDFEEIYGHTNDNTRVVPCGLDPAIFYPRNRGEARQRLNLPQDKTILLYVGRLDPRKGLEILLFSFRKMLYDLGARRDDVILVVVGGNTDQSAHDPELAHFRSLAASLQVGECADRRETGCVLFVGSQGQDTVADYYSAADVTLVPSYYEPFGMVAIETQACGTPAIASKVGGLRYAVKDGVGGLLAKPYSPEDLCAKMLRLCRDEGLRHRLARQGRERVLRKFTWDAVGRKLLQEYQDLLRRRREPVRAMRPAWPTAAKPGSRRPAHGIG
jgi:D-inositol-3-phosphate glycosyltransferase